MKLNDLLKLIYPKTNLEIYLHSAIPNINIDSVIYLNSYSEDDRLINVIKLYLGNIEVENIIPLVKFCNGSQKPTNSLYLNLEEFKDLVQYFELLKVYRQISKEKLYFTYVPMPEISFNQYSKIKIFKSSESKEENINHLIYNYMLSKGLDDTIDEELTFELLNSLFNNDFDLIIDECNFNTDCGEELILLSLRSVDSSLSFNIQLSI